MWAGDGCCWVNFMERLTVPMSKHHSLFNPGLADVSGNGYEAGRSRKFNMSNNGEPPAPQIIRVSIKSCMNI